MANLLEDNSYPSGIYQIEITDPVLGGPPNEATKAGVDNIPHQQLARRTNWLKARVDQLLVQVVAASLTVAGIVKLNASTGSSSTSEAATPSAVKAAMDNANARVPAARTIGTAGLATGGGDLAANRTITVAKSSQAQAEAGTDDATAMTPLRTAQAMTPRRVAEAYADAPTFHYGTLALLYRASTTALPPGAAVDGTALRRSSISRAANGSLTIMTSGVVMPGTWKCLSEIEASPGGSLGLYVRMIDA